MSLIVQFLTNIGLKTPDFEKAPYLEPVQDLTLGLSIFLEIAKYDFHDSLWPTCSKNRETQIWKLQDF